MVGEGRRVEWSWRTRAQGNCAAPPTYSSVAKKPPRQGRHQLRSSKSAERGHQDLYRKRRSFLSVREIKTQREYDSECPESDPFVQTHCDLLLLLLLDSRVLRVQERQVLAAFMGKCRCLTKRHARPAHATGRRSRIRDARQRHRRSVATSAHKDRALR